MKFIPYYNFKLTISIVILIFFFKNTTAQYKDDLIITDLKCEHLVNPLAIEISNPRLSWILKSSKQGQKQTAYQVTVLSDTDKLWDSGKITSDQSVNIIYSGKPLSSGQRAIWKVKVWDKDGKVYESSEAFWEAGLLNKEDWKAEWIGLEPAKSVDNGPEHTSKNVKWIIWSPEGLDDKDKPQGTRSFKKTFLIADLSKLKKTSLLVTSDDNSVIYINGSEIGINSWMSVDLFDMKPFLKTGSNEVEIVVTNNYGGGGLLAQILLETTSGEVIYLPTDKTWQVANKDQKFVEAMEKSNFGEGETLLWLNENMLKGSKTALLLPAPYLRKVFSLNKKVKRAKIYATAKGIYELHINGKRVSKDYFAPGWTDYTKRFLYQAYNVTNLLQDKENVIAGILGDGWFAGTIGWGYARNNYGQYPLKLLAQLQIEFTDGTSAIIGTDKSWKGSYGPILTSDFLSGEEYDARLEMKGWDSKGFNDVSWNNIKTYTISETINSDPGVPIQITQYMEPKSMKEIKPGVFIYDMAQNMVGWVRLKVTGKPGEIVKLRFGEMLNPDGSLYYENLRTAKSTDTYILKGNTEEIYEPHFTFHGFRYVEITGFTGALTNTSVTGCVVHSATPVSGSFECSSPLINQLSKNIVWGQRGNFISVPTDCPQRDERMGWMGDAQVFARTACYNMDVNTFFAKWIRDIADAQKPDGGFSNISPRVVEMDNGAPAWGDAGVIIPWTVFQFYDDKVIIEKYFKNMQAWVDYISSANPANLWLKRRSNDFGDWLSIGADTDKDVLATAFFANSTHIVSKAAGVLGRSEEEEKYENLFQKIKSAFMKSYVSMDGSIKGNTQTAYILALQFELLTDELRPLVAKKLVDDIKAHDMHHTTGFVGISHLMPALSATNNMDVAYTLLNNKTFPSWGYMIENGATTIWERWDGYSKEKGFQNFGMNSFNHYSFGSVGEWLYSTVGGIVSGTPGFKKIIIRPQPGGEITYAKTQYQSMYGMITSDWKLIDGKLILKVKIPVNTTADVYFPGTVNSTNAGEKIKKEGEHIIYEVGSGEYVFEGKPKNK